MFCIDQCEPEVEAPQKLDKPLMHQRFRENNEDTLGAPREVESVQDEAGLDRLTQPHFVGQQDAWHVAVRDL